VVGATTTILSIIVMLTAGLSENTDKLSLLHPQFLLGLVIGGSAIQGFTGASIQAVSTGLYQAIFMANAGGARDNAKRIVERPRSDPGPFHLSQGGQAPFASNLPTATGGGPPVSPDSLGLFRVDSRHAR